MRTTLLLTGTTLLGLAIAVLPQFSFAQSEPPIGLWQLNLAKSKFSPGPGPKSMILNYQREGQMARSRWSGSMQRGTRSFLWKPVNLVLVSPIQ
jgi:hypothetical protein